MPYFPRTLNPGPDEGSPDYRMSLLPFGTYPNSDGSGEHLGFAIPGMISEPVNALARLMGSPSHPGPFTQGPDAGSNAEDMRMLLEAFLGGNATRGMGAVEKAATEAALPQTMSSAVTGPISARAYRGSMGQQKFQGDMIWGSDTPEIAATYAGVHPNGLEPIVGSIAPMDLNFSHPLDVDATGNLWHSIPYNGSSIGTDDLAKMARSNGNDGLVIRNVRDSINGQTDPSTIYAALRPNTVTSPLTGETLFSDNLPSLPGAVIAGMDSGPIRAYRGSGRAYGLLPHEDSFFSSSSPEVAASYGENGPSPAMMPVDLNFSNPMTVDAQGNLWNRVPYNGKNYETNDLMFMAKKAGHDGLVVHNVIDDSNEALNPATTYAALKRGTVTSPLTGETLFSDGLPSLWSSSLQPQQDQRYPNALFTY